MRKLIPAAGAAAMLLVPATALASTTDSTVQPKSKAIHLCLT